MWAEMLDKFSDGGFGQGINKIFQEEAREGPEQDLTEVASDIGPEDRVEAVAAGCDAEVDGETEACGRLQRRNHAKGQLLTLN